MYVLANFTSSLSTRHPNIVKLIDNQKLPWNGQNVVLISPNPNNIKRSLLSLSTVPYWMV